MILRASAHSCASPSRSGRGPSATTYSLRGCASRIFSNTTRARAGRLKMMKMTGVSMLYMAVVDTRKKPDIYDRIAGLKSTFRSVLHFTDGITFNLQARGNQKSFWRQEPSHRHGDLHVTNMRAATCRMPATAYFLLRGAPDLRGDPLQDVRMNQSAVSAGTMRP